MGWGSGTAEFPYLVDPLSAITTRAAQDQSTVSSSTSDTDLAAAASTAAGKDVAFVFISSDSGEDYITVEGNQGDKSVYFALISLNFCRLLLLLSFILTDRVTLLYRNELTAWHGGDALVQAVAAVNPNTIVVVHSTGPILVEPWIDHPNGKSVIL